MSVMSGNDRDVSMKPLSERQRAFCRAIVEGMSGTAAAVAAGYSRTSADKAAMRLQDRDDVLTEIARLRAKVEAASILTAIDLQTWWSDVVRGKEADAEAKDRIRASQLLAQSRGMFVERVEIQDMPPFIVRVVPIP